MLGTLTFTPQPSLTFQSRRRGMSTRAAAVEAAPIRRSLYDVLRVERNASQVEIKTAYRTLAKLYHPDARSRFMDSSSTDGGDFIQIRSAYDTLSDPDARAVYDLDLLSVNSQRRWPGGGLSTARVYQTRRWETDQCW